MHIKTCLINLEKCELVFKFVRRPAPWLTGLGGLVESARMFSKDYRCNNAKAYNYFMLHVTGCFWKMKFRIQYEPGC